MDDEEKRQLIAKWFEKDRNSVLRQNKSGCVCIINDDDGVVSLCGAHEKYFKQRCEIGRMNMNWKIRHLAGEIRIIHPEQRHIAGSIEFDTKTGVVRLVRILVNDLIEFAEVSDLLLAEYRKNESPE